MVAGIIGLLLISQSGLAAASPKAIIMHGTLRAANGQLLRGMPLNIGKSNSQAVNDLGKNISMLRQFRDSLHSNTCRICFFDPRSAASGGAASALTMSQVMSYTDAIVNNAESLGLYIIIDYHGFTQYPWDSVSAWDPRLWWGAMAPRYKDKPWVMYELFNEPCGAPPGPVLQTAAIYKIVRQAAPNSIVLHISTMQITDSWVIALKALALQCGFDWKAGNDVFAYHPYGGSRSVYMKELLTSGVPSMCTEWDYVETGYNPPIIDSCVRTGELFERNAISWIDWHDWRATDALYNGKKYLLPDALAKGYAWWTNVPLSSPANLTVQASGSYSATLRWNRATAVGNGFLRYYVYRDGREIAGLIDTTFTDTGLQESTTYAYQVTVHSVGGIESARLPPASVTMLADHTQPALSLVSGAGDGRLVRVFFNEPVEQAGAQTASNFTIDNGVSISAATLAADRRTVTLTTSALLKNVTYTLAVNNIRDRAASPNSIAPNTSAAFQYTEGITRIRLYLRPNYSAPTYMRMMEGTIEATNGSPASGPFTTLATLPLSAPAMGWTEITTFDHFDIGYRYVRYHSPYKSFYNIGEMELYSGAAKATGTPFGSAGTIAASDYTRPFDGNTATYFDCSQSESVWAGLDIQGWFAAGARGWQKASDAPGMTTLRLRCGGAIVDINAPRSAIAGAVRVALYNLRGALVRTLTARAHGDGSAAMVADDGGATLARGQYVVRITTDSGESAGMMIVGDIAR